MNDKQLYDKFIQKKTTHKSENTTDAYIIEIRMFFRFINNQMLSHFRAKSRQHKVCDMPNWRQKGLILHAF